MPVGVRFYNRSDAEGYLWLVAAATGLLVPPGRARVLMPPGTQW